MFRQSPSAKTRFARWIQLLLAIFDQNNPWVFIEPAGRLFFYKTTFVNRNKIQKNFSDIQNIGTEIPTVKI